MITKRGVHTYHFNSRVYPQDKPKVHDIQNTEKYLQIKPRLIKYYGLVTKSTENTLEVNKKNKIK